MDNVTHSLVGSAGNLNYMLWHRGYTNTAVGCAVLALLLYAATDLVLRMRRPEPSREDRRLLVGTALLATTLHLAMDWLNSYGCIHSGSWTITGGTAIACS